MLALTDDQLRVIAPSIFASSPWGRMSHRYQQVPTIKVVDTLRDRGFVPTWASQSKSTIEGKGDFTKHLIRFRSEGLLNSHSGEIPELVLVNSHDGSSAYQFLAGIFRFICGNGMIVKSDDFGSVSVRHTGGPDFKNRVIDATYVVMEAAPKTMSSIREWKGIELTPPQQNAFAEAALELRKGESRLSPPQILTPRRVEDSGMDLWSTLNVVQENLLKGGLKARSKTGRRTSTRPIKAVSEDVRLNRALWTLTENMARLTC